MYLLQATCNYLYELLILSCAVFSVMRYRQLDKATHFICIWVWLGVATEIIAEFYARKYHNNAPVYSLSCLLELGIIGLYFNKAVAGLQKRHIALALTAGGVIAGLFHLTFLQPPPPGQLSSNFLFLECLMISAFSLFAIFKMQDTPSVAIWREVHFWIPAILLFYECTAFWNWAIYNYVINNVRDKAIYFSISLLLINIVTYAGILLVLIFYPKMQRSHV